MKSYWSIPGPHEAPRSHCIAFDKLDGSNLRFEWDKKQGWYRFGTRHRVIEESEPNFGPAFEIFKKQFAEPLERIVVNSKVEQVTAYCEFFGPSSFANYHDWTEPKELVLFDVGIYKKGFILPEDFVKLFSGLKIPDVVYEGDFTDQFIKDVQEGKYKVTCEGVVCKGVVLGKKKNPQHGLWMSKVKTKAWLDILKSKAYLDESLRKLLEEELAQQEKI
jgi:hypothetical protein